MLLNSMLMFSYKPMVKMIVQCEIYGDFSFQHNNNQRKNAKLGQYVNS